MPNYQNVKALFLYINLAENFTNRNSIAFVASSQNLTFANMCNCEATTEVYVAFWIRGEGMTVVWGAKSAHPGSNRVNWSAKFRGSSGPPSPPFSYTYAYLKVLFHRSFHVNGPSSFLLSSSKALTIRGLFNKLKIDSAAFWNWKNSSQISIVQ